MPTGKDTRWLAQSLQHQVSVDTPCEPAALQALACRVTAAPSPACPHTRVRHGWGGSLRLTCWPAARVPSMMDSEGDVRQRAPDAEPREACGLSRLEPASSGPSERPGSVAGSCPGLSARPPLSGKARAPGRRPGTPCPTPPRPGRVLEVTTTSDRRRALTTPSPEV